MSLNSKEEIWLELCRANWPTINNEDAQHLLTQAACDYYTDGSPALVEMFDQYVMLKTLKGFKNGNEKS